LIRHPIGLCAHRISLIAYRNSNQSDEEDLNGDKQSTKCGEKDLMRDENTKNCHENQLSCGEQSTNYNGNCLNCDEKTNKRGEKAKKRGKDGLFGSADWNLAYGSALADEWERKGLIRSGLQPRCKFYGANLQFILERMC
jgi:hypothetical protein